MIRILFKGHKKVSYNILIALFAPTLLERLFLIF